MNFETLPPFWNRLFLAVGMMSLFLALTVMLVEFTYRKVYKFQPSKNAYELADSAHVPRPYVMAVAEPRQEGVNSLGYKGSLPILPKPTNELRIAVLGGSTVFGEYIEKEKELGMSLPWHLERSLQKKYGSHIKVYNFGAVSSIAQQDLVRLYQDVVHFKPDLVIFYGGGNDHTSVEQRAGYPHRFLFYEANPLWIMNVSDYPLFHLFIYGSLATRHLFRGYFEEYFLSLAGKQNFYHPDLPHTQHKLENYVHALSEMKIVSEAYGAKFISFSQPMREMYFSDAEQMKYTKEWFASAKKQLAALSPNLKHVNLEDVFINDPESIWRDSVHIIESANIKMANQLSKNLASLFPKLFHGNLK